MCIKLKLSFFIFLLSFFIIGCSESPTDSKPKPPGYQEDIPWPSLADSPWPVYHGDPQSTGRSKYIGPSFGIISAIIEAKESQAGVIIGFDSTFYFTTKSELIASDYSGNIQWTLELGGEITTTPVFSKDSVLYITSGGLKKIYAISSSGKILWEYQSSFETWNITLGIDKNGNLYFIDAGNNLNVLNKNGQLIWQLHDQRFFWGSDAALSFSPDNKTLYLQGNQVCLIAVDIEQKEIKWIFGNTTMRTGAIIDNQGNIYIFPPGHSASDSNFYSLKPTGEIRWQFNHTEKYQLDNIEPTLDRNGNIYFGYENLYSLDYEGNLNWKLELDGVITTSLICDRIGNVFVSITNDLWSQKVLCIDSKGNILWVLPIENERGLNSSAAISDEGLLIYSTFRSNNTYIIK